MASNITYNPTKRLACVKHVFFFSCLPIGNMKSIYYDFSTAWFSCSYSCPINKRKQELLVFDYEYNFVP